MRKCCGCRAIHRIVAQKTHFQHIFVFLYPNPNAPWIAALPDGVFQSRHMLRTAFRVIGGSVSAVVVEQYPIQYHEYPIFTLFISVLVWTHHTQHLCFHYSLVVSDVALHALGRGFDSQRCHVLFSQATSRPVPSKVYYLPFLVYAYANRHVPCTAVLGECISSCVRFPVLALYAVAYVYVVRLRSYGSIPVPVTFPVLRDEGDLRHVK